MSHDGGGDNNDDDVEGETRADTAITGETSLNWDGSLGTGSELYISKHELEPVGNYKGIIWYLLKLIFIIWFDRIFIRIVQENIWEVRVVFFKPLKCI